MRASEGSLFLINVAYNIHEEEIPQI